MIKIAICDDEEEICIKLEDIVKKYFLKIQRPISIVKFRNGIELLKVNIRFDVIFLDIDMKGLDGIETAKKLRKWDVNSKIIYVTNYNKYKDSALDNAVQKQKFAFKTEKGILTIELDDIYYFEYMSRRTIINSTKGNYITTYSLKELYGKFSKYNFELSHKSFIINMLHIRYIKGFDIFMENEEIIPLAQKRAVEFKARFNEFLQSTFDKI